MKHNRYILTQLSVILLTCHVAAEEKWTDLLDPQLSQCELWMGVPHTSVKGLPEGTPQNDTKS